MADVNYGTQFLGFDDNGFQGEDLTISPPRYHPNVGGDTPPRYKANVDSIPMPVQEGRDSIPHAAHEGESSFASTSFDSEAGFGPKIVSMSFDSEAGYGAKISDFVEYVEELERPEEVLGSNGTYDLSVEAEAEAEEAAAEGEGVAKKLSFVPESFTSPPRSVDVSSNVFKAYDFDKTFTPKLSKSEFNDAHSPVSASKYIERSLHDLDDLINLRRLELSELKRSHSQRPGSTQEYSNPLHKGKNSTSRLNSPIPVNGSDGSPNPAASPSMTIPKATYESMRDKERNATQMLKAEQAKMKRLELQYQDLEFQNSMHLERLSVVKAEKLRLDKEAAQGGEEARSLSGEVQHLKDQLMARNNHVVELAKEVRALQEEIKERILEEARNKESRDKGNREREEKEREREREMRDKEREREVFETPSPSESQKNWERGSDSFSADKGERERERDTANGNDEEKKCNSFTSPHASADMVMKISELQAEADQLRARCETAEGLNIDLGQQVEAMVQLRETLELEKSNANLVAFQWHGEASLLETDLKSSQEECSELKRKTEEVETVVIAKDEKIAALVLILQETLEREKEREREDEAKRVLALQRSSSSAPPRALGPPPMASTPTPASAPPMTAPLMTAPLSVTPSADDPDNFWSDQKSPEGLHHGMDSATKTGASASLAKRVLITWDRTPGGRVKPSAPRSTGAVSFSAFLMTLAFFQGTVWFLLLLASYLFFADFKSCSLETFRYTN